MKYPSVRIPLFTATVFSLLIPPLTLADTKEKPTQIVVSAYRLEQNIEDVSLSTTVIDRERLEKLQAPTALEVLREVPGLIVTQIGSRGAQTSIFVRGAEADHVLVLIDGMRVNNRNDGAFNFADIPTAQIERIEIVKGAQSIVYGSEAIAGTINIITKSGSTAPLSPSVNFTTQYGSQDTTDSSLSVDLSLGKGHTSATTFSFLHTEGISTAQTANGNIERDSYQNFNLAHQSALEITENTKIIASASYISAFVELDDFSFSTGLPTDALDAEQKRQLFSSSLVAQTDINEDIDTELEVGYYDEVIDGTDNNSEFNNFRFLSSVLNTTGKVTYSPSDDITLIGGYSFEDRNGSSRGNFSESQQVHSVFSYALFDINDQTQLTLGVRNDDNSDFGNRTTYRATALVRVPSIMSTLHSSIGTGFKAPAFNELFFPNFGNPNLDAEKSISFDAGVTIAEPDGSISFDSTFFQIRTEDLIAFDNTTFTAMNIQNARAQGVENTLSFNITDALSADASYVYTDTKNKQTYEQLPRRATHQTTTTIRFENEELFASLSHLTVYDRKDVGGTRLDDYSLLNLQAQYKKFKSFTPFVRIMNLLDYDYEEITGYGTTGITAFAGVKITS